MHTDENKNDIINEEETVASTESAPVDEECTPDQEQSTEEVKSNDDEVSLEETQETEEVEEESVSSENDSSKVTEDADSGEGQGEPEENNSIKNDKREVKEEGSPAASELEVTQSGKGMSWYVVHSLSGQEQKVKNSMDSRIKPEEMTEFISQILIPTENVSEVKSGKKRVSSRKFYPGYVLVNMIFNDDTWYFIKETPGVIGFIGAGKPVPLRDDEVNAVVTQVEEKKEKVKPKILFEIGEIVKVKEGPFINFTGSIEEINPDRGRLRVMVLIFGRATPVELEYWQVEKT